VKVHLHEPFLVNYSRHRTVRWLKDLFTIFRKEAT